MQYGWRCPPAVVPADEMETLLAVLEPDQLALVTRCYLRDDNQVPAQYVLLPISTIVPASGSKDATLARMGMSTWWKLQVEVMGHLRAAVVKSSMPDDKSWKFLLSITDQEVNRAIEFNKSVEVCA